MESRAGLAYEERGTGEVVSLVHAGVFGAWFAPLFADPALDGFRAVRPLRPGYGGTAAPAEHYTMGDHATRCGALLQELSVDRAHWVGHSSSCCMGLQLALDQPDLVASLILYEPARPAGPIQREHAPRYIRPALAAAAEGDIPRAFDAFLRGVGGGYRDALHQNLGEGGLKDAVRDSAYFFADELPAVGEWTFGDAEGRQITAPTLVALGSESPPWFHENVELFGEDGSRGGDRDPARPGPPGYYSGFAAVALQEPENAVKELRRTVGDLGFKGVLVNGYTNTTDPAHGRYLDDPAYHPFWGGAMRTRRPPLSTPASRVDRRARAIRRPSGDEGRHLGLRYRDRRAHRTAAARRALRPVPERPADPRSPG
jgi:pimeloyl-ACP methyl ester carboxylesterase